MTETTVMPTPLDGSSDPAGPFYVPAELRDFYVVNEAAEQEALRASGTPTTLGEGNRSPLTGLYAGPLNMVRQRWADDVFRRVRADRAVSERYASWIQDVIAHDTPANRLRLVTGYLPESVTGPIPNDYAPEDVRLWVHRWRLGQATAAANRHRVNADEHRRWVARHTCAVCQAQDEDVESRDVHGARVQCCYSCSVLLGAAAVERIANGRVGDRTRGELVRDYLRRQTDQAGGTGMLAALRAAVQ